MEINKNLDGGKDRRRFVMAFGNKGKRKYSVKEKEAYHAGRAYKRVQQGKRMGLRTKREQESFKNGFKRG